MKNKKWKCISTEYPENWIVGKIYEEGHYEMLENEKGERVARESVKFTTIFEEFTGFDWESFKDARNRIGVSCKTLDEAKDFMSKCAENGVKWRSGEECDPRETYWYIYGTRTIYNFVPSATFKDGFGYGTGITIPEENIINWSDFMDNKPKTISDYSTEELLAEIKERCK